VLDGEATVISTDPGFKLTAASQAAPVALDVDSVDSLFRSGWSVLVRGRAEVVTDPKELDRLDRLQARSWDGRKTHRIRIRPLQMTGRRLSKAWRYPDPPKETNDH